MRNVTKQSELASRLLAGGARGGWGGGARMKERWSWGGWGVGGMEAGRAHARKHLCVHIHTADECGFIGRILGFWA